MVNFSKPNMFSGQQQLNVKKQIPTFVPPAEETPKGLYFLSNLDHLVARRLQFILCFKSSIENGIPAEVDAAVIKDALAKVLVYYYPLAGRLTINAVRKLIVNCTGEGVVFVEAEADCAMEEIANDIQQHDQFTLRKLVHDIPRATNHHTIVEIPLVAQVTKFQCGGFVLGLSTNHCMFDGIAIMEFANSWGEVARGLPLTVPPFLDRSLLKAQSSSPNYVQLPPPGALAIEDISNTSDRYQEEMVYMSFIFHPENLEKLKAKAMEDGVLEKCTTFEALSAFVWKARTKALRMRPDQKIKLLIVADGRSRFEPPLPKGYFGNGFMLMDSVCNAGELMESSMSFAVELIQKKIKMATNDYFTYAIDDYLKIMRDKPTLTATLEISTWSNLPFQAIDFGWGGAISLGPVGWPSKEMVLFIPHGDEMKSISVLLGLPSSSMKIFREYIDANLKPKMISCL